MVTVAYTVMVTSLLLQNYYNKKKALTFVDNILLITSRLVGAKWIIFEVHFLCVAYTVAVTVAYTVYVTVTITFCIKLPFRYKNFYIVDNVHFLFTWLCIVNNCNLSSTFFTIAGQKPPHENCEIELFCVFCFSRYSYPKIFFRAKSKNCTI